MGKAPTPFGTAFKYEKKNLKIVGGNPNMRSDVVDKVTGRARYAADIYLPNQLVGKCLRSPHAHARIRSIDTSAAEQLPGVKAVVTRDDFPDMVVEHAASGELMINFRDVTRGMMAREKALYDGHPVAAVAATSESIAKAALKLIKVDYEVLPHVIDVEEAMRPDAPLLHEDQITKGVLPAPTRPSNIAAVLTSKLGDVAAGFAKADIIIEREFRTKATHQSPNGYSEPDFLGWEVKQYGVSDFIKYRPKSPVTLMTPEPTGGIYRDGVEAFLREFGYPDKTGRADRINFGGVYRAGGDFHPDTGLALRITGFDPTTGKITDLDGALVLLDVRDRIAASWGLRGLMDHWNRKHVNFHAKLTRVFH